MRLTAKEENFFPMKVINCLLYFMRKKNSLVVTIDSDIVGNIECADIISK